MSRLNKGGAAFPLLAVAVVFRGLVEPLAWVAALTDEALEASTVSRRRALTLPRCKRQIFTRFSVFVSPLREHGNDTPTDQRFAHS